MLFLNSALKHTLTNTGVVVASREVYACLSVTTD